MHEGWKMERAIHVRAERFDSVLFLVVVNGNETHEPHYVFGTYRFS